MGKANVILDNLMAQGKVKPMIVVMPLGYGTMEVISRAWRTWRDAELIRAITPGSQTPFFRRSCRW